MFSQKVNMRKPKVIHKKEQISNVTLVKFEMVIKFFMTTKKGNSNVILQETLGKTMAGVRNFKSSGG